MSAAANLLATTELQRSQDAIQAALRVPLPKDVRTQLMLQERRNRIAIESGEGRCGHPLQLARFDGLWPADTYAEPAASMTCLAVGCDSSFNATVRADVARRYRRALVLEDRGAASVLRALRTALVSWMDYAGAAGSAAAREGWQWCIDDADALLAEYEAADGGARAHGSAAESVMTHVTACAASDVIPAGIEAGTDSARVRVAV